MVNRGLIWIILAAVALVAAPSAAAEESHEFSGAFGAGELSLTVQSGVAVDQEVGGGVYVADTGNNRIAKYGPEGEPLADLAHLTEPTFLAVDNSSGSGGDLYAVSSANQKITKLTSAGTAVADWGAAGSMEGFGEIAGVAVDPAGNLFVLGMDGKLHELNSAGVPIGASCEVPYVSGRDQVLGAGIGVDSDDNLYFARYFERPSGGNVVRSVAKITSACAGLVESWGGRTGWRGISVDEVDDSVFLAEGSPNPVYQHAGVAHYSPNGEVLEAPFGASSAEPGEERTGPLEVSAQLAVRSASSVVYVADPAKDYVAIFKPESIEPPEPTFEEPGAVSEISGHTARFKAQITLTGYEVKYSFHCSPSCSGTGLSETLPASTATETVEATAEGLTPLTEYHVYITAENASGAGGSVRAPEPPSEGLPFTTSAAAPAIEGEVVTEASETDASLEARINPGGVETSYVLQYVTRARYEASEFAEAGEAGEGTLPAGTVGVAVTASIGGLTPSTPYVFRAVASNSVEEVVGGPVFFSTQGPNPIFGGCPNEIFRSGPSGALPDCRAFEQSTPVDKNGGGVSAVPGAVQATEAPDSLTYYSQAGIPGGVGAQDYPTFISSRGEGSWGTQGLLPPQALGRQAAYLGLTPGGRYAITEARGAGPHGEDLGFGLFRRDLRDGEVTTLVPYSSECAGALCLLFDGASADGSRIFFESTAPLTGETPPGQPNVFVWEESTGELSLVDVSEAGQALPEGGFAGPYDWVDDDPLVGGAERMYVGAAGAVSRDGSQIVFTEVGEEEGHGQLYVRRGIGTVSPTTTKISAYQGSASGPELSAAFLEATPDGRYVFFKSKAALTEDAYAGEAGDESASLYRYDTVRDTLIDLTPDPAEAQEEGPGVEGMLGSSESGQVAYFVAKAVLSENEGPTHETAVAGEANLYRWEDGAPLAFVAKLQGGILANETGDSRDWSPATEDPKVRGGSSIAKTARVSADGRSVVFSSVRALTGAPNEADSCAKNEYERRCAEFFHYSVADEALNCVSCDPSGARPIGGATIGSAFAESHDTPFVAAAAVLSRNLSADGSRFFFQTPDPLVAADHNTPGCVYDPVNPRQEEVTCMDVYEWEAPGSGTCSASTANSNGGCIYLISSGQSDQPSYFADADRAGENAYFFTASGLVPADKDQLYDIYDAREYGGLASQHAQTPVPCGSRDACQGSQATPGAAVLPGTSDFVGPGNSKAPKCRKGLQRRHGKCVKQHRHHKKHRHHRRHRHHGGKGHHAKNHRHKQSDGQLGAGAKGLAGHDRGDIK
jgi:hypothetical protein